jgi:protein-tyrosine phosphatase
MDEPTSRHVSFEACFNFRDLGGYPTADGGSLRWNTLYRSDTLHRLTPSDVDVFASLGLRTVIDLRSKSELSEYGRLRTDAGTVDWHHSPMLDNLNARGRTPAAVPTEDYAAGSFYMRVLEAFRDSVVQTFRLLAGEGALPAVFHCTGGRDRTGMVAALVLDMVGVPDGIIGDDYLLTQRAGERTRAWIEANEPQLLLLATDVPPEIRELRSEVILGFLGRVRTEYGSTAGFLARAGFGDDEQERLRNRLVDDAA